MKTANQSSTQTILEHGESIKSNLEKLLYSIRHDIELPEWKIPDWIKQYKNQILSKLLPDDIILEYALFHDCGKPLCITFDEQGRQHFPNHAEISSKLWLDNGGCPIIGNLIIMDMDIHLLKADGLVEFSQRPEAITLLLAGLTEIHANAYAFNPEENINSLSFKIKYNQIDKRGKAICKLLFD